MLPQTSDSTRLDDGCGFRELLESFSYDGYRQLLNRLRARHAFCGFADDLPQRGSFVLLRHDVDLSLEAAVRMAELEQEEGVRSTYFILFSSPFYNPLEPGAEQALRSIVRAGHEVGLHYDAAAMETQAANGDAEQMARGEAALLANMTGTEIRCVAMHNPSLFSGGDPLASSTVFVNASVRTVHDDLAYHSDSCGAWRTASLQALTAVELPPRLHLLTHPELWSSEGGSRWDRLEPHIARRRQALNDALSYTLQVYRNHPGVIEHDARRGNRA